MVIVVVGQGFQNAVQGRLQSKGFSGLSLLFEPPAETMRWYLWHGKMMTAATILKVLQIDCDRLRAETRELREAARRVKARCQDLYSYLSNNFDALPDYGCLYRNGLAVSSSRAEGCVDVIGNGDKPAAGMAHNCPGMNKGNSACTETSDLEHYMLAPWMCGES